MGKILPMGIPIGTAGPLEEFGRPMGTIKQKQVKVAKPKQRLQGKSRKKKQRLQSKSGKKTNCKAKAKITKQEHIDELNTYNELEVFVAYESVDDADDLSNNDDFDSNEELSVGKPFQNWDNSNGQSCWVECPWKVNIWAKKDKNCLEVTTFNNKHVGHVLNPLASHFDPTLRKLPKEIVEKIRFLTTVARADATMQYRIIREKFKVKIHQSDLYSTIQKFCHEITLDEDNTGLLLKRLNEKKLRTVDGSFL
ncbi:hypothetical protein C2G38_2183361 [Gigaspora rosea]|uniref:Uncharacterized protein n=1 Tax=Gigaspora rosea TaxID=44941 RepID=A0A397VAB3_9GLOM|nr:hypothetical protein C2G38_2183361 [Gigaspora rosea]